MTSPYASAAFDYWHKGWRGVLPLPARSKFPPPNGYTGQDGDWPSYPDVYAWTEEHESDDSNIGIRLPANIIGLDVDHYAGKQGADVLWAKEREWGQLPGTWSCSSRRDGLSGIRLFTVPEGMRWPGELGPGVDIIQTRHRYMVAPPSVHPSGDTYAWRMDGIPHVAELPELPESWVVGLTRGEYAVEYARADARATNAFYDRLRMGIACPATRGAAGKVVARLALADGSSRHDTALRGVMRLVHLGAEGHIGTLEALTELRDVWLSSLDGTRTEQQASDEWSRMLRGAVSIAAANHPHPVDYDPCDVMGALVGTSAPPPELSTSADTPQETQPPTAALVTAHEQLVANYVLTMRAQRDARTRLDDEQHQASWREPPSYGALRDELELPDEAVAWRVEQLAPSASNVLLTAQFKTGKTTLVNHLTRCLVDGKPFLGAFPVHSSEHVVALWNYEVGAAQYRRWMRDVGIEHGERVHMLHLRGMLMPLTVSRVADWAVAWLAEREVRTWIVDPLARALSGLDENSNTEVGRFLELVDTIKERAGVHELVLPTHTGRAAQEIGQERARGATRLDDWADVRWQLTKDTEGVRHFSASGRDVEVPEGGIAFDVLTRDMTFREGESRVSKANAAAVENVEDWVVRAVTAAPGIGQKAVGRWIREQGGKVRDERVAAAVQALASQSVIVMRPASRGIALYTAAHAVSLPVS